MRHGKHRFLLGCTKEHREALMANLASALLRHGKIETTLAKAKALRPFVEKIITMAKKAYLAEDSAQKLHYRRLAIARIKDEDAVATLFNDRASEFVRRNGGYSRIYKLVPRIGDAARIAIIELVRSDDVGYAKSKKRNTTKAKKSKQQREVVSSAVEPKASTLLDQSTSEVALVE
jgi:large subunit ribosomal protein L17